MDLEKMMPCSAELVEKDESPVGSNSARSKDNVRKAGFNKYFLLGGKEGGAYYTPPDSLYCY